MCVCVSGNSTVDMTLSGRENLHQMVHGIGVSELQETPATHTFISHLRVYNYTLTFLDIHV